MMNVPSAVYFEKKSDDYDLGKQLLKKYIDLGVPVIWIDDHNKIPELRQRENADFPKLKNLLVIGIRKSLTHRRNNKTSDFLVPYTSSGCSAMCLYCYLVCTYYTSAYLRIFVNREAMMKKLLSAAEKYPGSVFEIGSNSDLVLENSYSGNLEWTIRSFRDVKNATLTLPTKFNMIDSLLNIDHGHNVTIRMSLNPEEIIRRVEFGTSRLAERIEAVNKLYAAGYDVGILIAPIILLEGYQDMYERLFQTIAEKLNPQIINSVLFEIIYMTYGTVTRTINDEAFPNAVQLHNADTMAYCGRHRSGYKPDVKTQATLFIKQCFEKYLPQAQIAYIV
jgi:spore photoproduct lyase